MDFSLVTLADKRATGVPIQTPRKVQNSIFPKIKKWSGNRYRPVFECSYFFSESSFSNWIIHPSPGYDTRPEVVAAASPAEPAAATPPPRRPRRPGLPRPGRRRCARRRLGNEPSSPTRGQAASASAPKIQTRIFCTGQILKKSRSTRIPAGTDFQKF